MNESFVKYLAGLLDADGSLSFTFRRDENREGRYYVGLRLNLAASDAVDKHGFVESLPETIGMGFSSRYGDKHQYVTWGVAKRSHLEMLLPRLIKHMVIKAQHWQWLLDYWRVWREGGFTCSEEERVKMAEMAKESRRNNRGPIKPKNHPTWAWLAGYIDGDGCYTHRKNKANTGYWQWSINVSIVVHVNDVFVAEFIKASLGGRVEMQKPTVYVWKRSLGYQNRDFALDFLHKMAKHSRLKRPKIDAMIHHHQQRLSVPGTAKQYCTIDGCNRRNHGNGLCSMHYQRESRAV